MLDVCLLGTGGMMPLPDRRLTSLMLRYNGSSMLIDCGEGTQVAIREKGWSFHDIDIICFTHYHADHISGLPGLLLSMGNAERKEPITMIGPRGLQRVVESLRIIAPDLPFEIKFEEIMQPKKEYTINGFTIGANRVNHNVICYGYSVSIRRGGKFFPKRAEENNIPLKCWNKLQKGETVEVDGVVYTPDMVIGPERKGIKIAYCTDTRPVSTVKELAQDADLFICEGMYGEDEKVEKAEEHKHMMMREAAMLAKEANAKEVWFTHYSPALVRPDVFIKDIKKIYEPVKAGKDGMSAVLEFEED